MTATARLRALRDRRVGGLPLPDVALAAAVAVASAVQVPLTDPMPSERDSDPVVITVALVMSAALAWRRVRPATSFAVVLALGTVTGALDYPTAVADLFVVVSLYSLAAYSTPRRVVWLSVALVAINQFGTYMDHLVLDREPAEEYVVTAVSGPLLMLAVVWWGSSIRLHRERQSERVEQATRQERLLRLEAERALAQERLEIARELHDLVAHHVSGMVLQAAAAQRGSGTAQADEALGRIRHSGVAALAAMREVLGLLRADPDEAGDPQAPRHPQPRLADVQALVADSRAAGASVHLTVTGRPRQLPDSLELCAYRIVQEALTNAARHAPGGEVRIRLDHQPAALDIRVDSDAEGPAASHLTAVPTPQDAVPQRLGSGLGLTGMRERVVAAGGQLQVGPTETGWVVHARLPTLEVPAHLAG